MEKGRGEGEMVEECRRKERRKEKERGEGGIVEERKGRRRRRQYGQIQRRVEKERMDERRRVAEIVTKYSGEWRRQGEGE